MKEFKQYKIEAKDHKEKAEIIGLFVKLGYEDYDTDDKYNCIIVFDNGWVQSITSCRYETSSFEQITIEQLLEMAEMKEYLVKENGVYVLHVGGVMPSGAIEVPEGAELYVDLGGVRGFYKNNFKQFWGGGNWEDAVHNSENLKIWNKVPVLWQRHTQPEELPFIDDELKKHSHYFIDVSDVDEVDFYEIAGRFGVSDPCVQHILKKCLAIGKRGHKDTQEDMLDIYKTAKRMIEISGIDQENK